VAEAAADLADRIDARVIVLGGDVRATHLVLERLPDRLAERTQTITSGRAVDGSEDERRTEIHRIVATAVAEDSVAVLQKFKEERGQNDRAADGRADTIDALNRAAVAVLLVADDPDADDEARTDDEAAGGVLVDGPLPDALVRAAWATGASVRVVPRATVTDGVGALLRWSDH
ncbi:MAG: hypothetical protein ACJ739_14805, partial [Acidimicrobiales bacterium]